MIKSGTVHERKHVNGITLYKNTYKGDDSTFDFYSDADENMCMEVVYQLRDERKKVTKESLKEKIELLGYLVD